MKKGIRLLPLAIGPKAQYVHQPKHQHPGSPPDSDVEARHCDRMTRRHKQSIDSGSENQRAIKCEQRTDEEPDRNKVLFHCAPLTRTRCLTRQTPRQPRPPRLSAGGKTKNDLREPSRSTRTQAP